MRTLLAVSLLSAVGLAPAADPPAKKADPPHVLLTFEPKGNKEWATTYELTTASGATYELRIEYGARGNAYHAYTLKAMLAANWVAEPTQDRNARVYGVRTKEAALEGKTDPVASLVVTNRLLNGMGELTEAKGIGGAKVEVRTDNGVAKPDPKRKAQPAGPKIADDTFVEFDLAPLPAGADNVYWEIKWEVQTTAGKGGARFVSRHEVLSLGAVETITSDLDRVFPWHGFKGESVGGTKVRVYGGVRNGQYYPATTGSVESPHLKKEQLPKVTNAVKDL